MSVTKNILGEITNQETLSRDLYIYCNYERLLEDGNGLCMKESKEFYEYRVLSALSAFCQDKTEEEIKTMISNGFED